MTVAATWDRDLVRNRSLAIASEFKGKGVNIWLGPVTGGPLGRSPLGGRNFEGFSSDSYLNGEFSYQAVKAAQENGLMTVAKHYILYEQETYRTPYSIPSQIGFANADLYENYQRENGSLPIDSMADDKTTHETYLWSFAEAVRAGTAHIMCSYNRVNGSHACENDYTMNVLLKEELAFSGSVISDWGGTWTTAKSALAGLDVTMPGSNTNSQGDFFGDELVSAVNNGDVPEERLDDMLHRFLTVILHFQGNYTQEYPSARINNNNYRADGPTNNVRRDHYKLIKQIGEESVTLLKNNRTGSSQRGLPLRSRDEIESIAILGEDAAPKIHGYTSCGLFGDNCPGDVDYNPPQNGTLSVGGGSGWAQPPYIIDLLAAMNFEAREGGFDMNVDIGRNISAAVLQAQYSEVAIVSVDAYAREASDRQNITLFGQGDELIKQVAAVNNDTVVVIHGPGPVLLEEWIDHPNVTAVLYAYYPGQEAGTSLIPILFGDKSPSGRLPFTMAKRQEDYIQLDIAYSADPKSNFTEGNFIDYKWFEQQGIEPRYHFGHGLTYSTFEYGDLSIQYEYKEEDTSIQPTNEKFDKTYGQGSSIYDQLLIITLPVTNTGSVVASEVAQLYLMQDGVHTLRGFEKLKNLQPGETRTATFEVRRKDVSRWSVERQEWYIPSGELMFEGGKSVGHLASKATFQFTKN